MAITATQPDSRFTGPAYRYLLDTDRLPSYAELPDVESTNDYVCPVKLFLPEGRWTMYVAAVTEYGDETESHRVITGWLLSPLGRDCDEWGDSGLDEVIALRSPMLGLPIERDVTYEPMTVGKIREAVEAQGYGP